MSTISNEIVLPFGLTFQVWVERLINNFPRLNIPLGFPESNWWGWAEQLIQLPEFRVAPIPSRKVYKEKSSWRTWVLYLIQSYQ